MSSRNLQLNAHTAGGLAAIVLWSTTFAFARSLSERVGPLTAGACAYLIGGFFCLVRLWWSGKTAGHRLNLSPRYLLGCGSLFVVYTAAIYLAVGLAKDREQVLEVALVNYLWPALTILFSLPLLGRKASVWLLPGTALALGGVLLVMTQGTHTTWQSFGRHVQDNPAAYGLALLAAVSWGCYSNLARRWSGPESEGAVELFMPATGIVLLVIRLLTTEPAGWTARCVGEAAALAAVTTVAYVLWDLSMRKGNMLLVVACSYFTPLLSTLVSCAYLRVTPGPRLWVGCLLLVMGSLVTWRSVSDEPPRSS
ncbi:MAG: aromatic amino acid DMT transporter YddG [Verrucomicrobiia bacterium]